MFNLQNISVNDFFKMEDETLVKKYLRFTDNKDGFYIQPSGTFLGFKGVPLGSLTYGQVASIKNILAAPTEEVIFKAFSDIFRVKQSQYLSAKIVDFMGALNYIKEEVEHIINTEKELFESDPDPLMEEAGLARLTPFGELNILKSLGKQFGKSPQEVEGWNYNLVISLVVHENITADIEKKYLELNQKRNGPQR